MRSNRKYARVRDEIRLAKAKREQLTELFPQRDRMFLIFAKYFLDQLEKESTPEGVVSTFMAVTAHLYSPKAFALYPKLVPPELVLLRYQRKMQFFWRFPELVRVLFSPELATELIQAFEQANARYRAFQMNLRGRSLPAKS